MFGKILIANRGEIAVRIIRACRELGVRSVVAYSTADRGSLAVSLADEAFCVGPGPAGRSYRNIPALLYACARTGAEAVQPGYGFLSEDQAFAQACQAVGVHFIGPSVRHIALMGDKIEARATMARAGLPVLPGSEGALSGLDEACAEAERIGYPVVVKAAAGGGGRGIAAAQDAAELAEAFRSAQATARTLFGDDRVYAEKLVEGARHVEVQVLGDRHGALVHLGERDCTVQRRRQKLLEESPSPGIADKLRERLCELAVAGARFIGYHSAGTMEFLVGMDGTAYFIEMNTRLQVEHPVTEARCGLDLVAWMIRIAAGEPLGFSQADVGLTGHAIEARINAEDAGRDWAGSTGSVSSLRLPGGPGVRVDTHLFDGCDVPPFYDSLLAKVIAVGPDRPAALRVLRRALDEFHCSGFATNVTLHRRLLGEPAFVEGRHDLGTLGRMLAAKGAS